MSDIQKLRNNIRHLKHTTAVREIYNKAQDLQNNYTQYPSYNESF